MLVNLGGEFMTSCTFFGNRDAPQEIEPKLYATIKCLIEEQHISIFYVGNNGNFDRLVLKCLKKLKNYYPDITIFMMLAYLPTKEQDYSDDYKNYGVFPDELTHVMPRFAIESRNLLMLKHCECVVTYVRDTTGNSRKLKDIALKRHKAVIELYGGTKKTEQTKNS